MERRRIGRHTIAVGLFWLWAASAGAETGAAITASGHGAVQVKADTAVVELSVETTEAKAADAAEANARRTQQVLAALDRIVGKKGLVETRGYRLSPMYPGRDRQRPASYMAANTVVVELTDVAEIGRVVDAAIDTGANRIIGIRLEASQRPALQRQALALAVADARASAETMATAAGVRLGPVVHIRSAPGYSPPMEMRTMDLGAAATPFRAGTLTVEATVELVMAIESP